MRLQRWSIAALSAVLIGVAGASWSSQMLAARFAHQEALGPRLALFGQPLYPPFAIVAWSERWSGRYPRAFAWPKLVFTLTLLSAGLTLLLGLRPLRPHQGPFGARAWGDSEDADAAALFAEGGVVLGRFKGEILAYDGPHHLLLTGGTRSGKTRGAVIPTLLAAAHSVLALDLKGELFAGDARVGFPGTAGWRARLGPVFRFAPAEENSDRLNILDTVRLGPQEIRDIQNIVELIADPYGDGRFQEFWDRASKQILTGLILHVLYAEPAERKTLARVFELLARFDDTVKLMDVTLHRRNAQTGAPETHPEVRRAANSYAAYHDKLRAGIKATAESYLGVFADPLVQTNTATSTFRISDLMCGDKPATLYLSWPPNDAKRVKPVMRLVFGAILRVLMEHQERAADGRVKTRRLLLLLDEFPQLGRLDLFEQSMGVMAGYGIVAFMVTQSLHHVTQIYGRYHTILDNAHIVTTFAATDVETAETISKLAGDIYEMRPQETWSGKRQLLGLDRRAITYREERRPLLLPSEVRRLSEREELIFVTGAKPLRAKKLRYDEEPIFRARLLPVPALAARAPLASPWAEIKSLGVAVRAHTPPASPAPAAAPSEPYRPTSKPVRPRPPARAAQGDFMALLDAPLETPSETPAPDSAKPAASPDAAPDASSAPLQEAPPASPPPSGPPSSRSRFDLMQRAKPADNAGSDGP